MGENLKPMMPVQLRGHHFLCILTYRGKGYTQAFVERMSGLVGAINAGRPVQLVTGPDDICAGLTDQCRSDVSHDCAARDILRLDKLAVDAVSAVLKRDLTTARTLLEDDVGTLRIAYASGTIRAACSGCSWKDFCDQIVDEKFAQTKLFPQN